MIPLKVVIPLLLLVPLTVWFMGVRKYNFMEARDIPENELRPEFASPVERRIADLLATPEIEEPQEEEPVMPEINVGDFQISPGLEEYRADSEFGAPALLNLGQRLQAAGQVQRALLAYERVLDSSPTGTSTQQEAEAALANLKEVIPMWNPDPTASVALQIHLDTARTPESLAGTITTLTELIRVSSGSQSQPKFRIISSPKPSHKLPSLPVAIWLTIPGEDPEKPSLAIATVTPKSDEELDSSLTHGVYRLLSKRIELIAQLTPPPALLQGEDPENAIVNKITRLAWKQILSTPFQSLEAGPPSDFVEEAANAETESETESETNAAPAEGE